MFFVVVEDDLLWSSPPLQIRQHPHSQIAIAGSRVTFRCEYATTTTDSSLQRDERVRVSWLFDASSSSTTTSTPKFIKLTDIEQFDFDTNALHILAYNPTLHTGQYRCLVNSSLTSPPLVLLSQPANLSLAGERHSFCKNY